MQSLLSSPDYFHCDHYHATLPMATCVARRRATQVAMGRVA